MIPLFVEWDEMTATYVILIAVFGGMFALFTVLLKPYVKRPDGRVVADGLVVDSGVVRKLRPGETYQELVRFDMTFYIILPVIVIMSILMFVMPDPNAVAIVGIVNVFLAVLAVVFTNLVVEADREKLSFRYGPVGKDIPMDDVESIRATSVQPV